MGRTLCYDCGRGRASAMRASEEVDARGARLEVAGGPAAEERSRLRASDMGRASRDSCRALETGRVSNMCISSSLAPASSSAAAAIAYLGGIVAVVSRIGPGSSRVGVV